MSTTSTRSRASGKAGQPKKKATSFAFNVRIEVKADDATAARREMKKLAREISERDNAAVYFAMICVPRYSKGKLTHYEWVDVAGIG